MFRGLNTLFAYIILTKVNVFMGNNYYSLISIQIYKTELGK